MMSNIAVKRTFDDSDPDFEIGKRKRPAKLQRKRLTADDPLSKVPFCAIQDEQDKVELNEEAEIEVKEENIETDDDDYEFYLGDENQIEEIGNDLK